MKERVRVEIYFNSGTDKPFRYNGFILEENQNFIVLDEQRLGKIKLNVNNVISIREVY